MSKLILGHSQGLLLPISEQTAPIAGRSRDLRDFDLERGATFGATVGSSSTAAYVRWDGTDQSTAQTWDVFGALVRGSVGASAAYDFRVSDAAGFGTTTHNSGWLDVFPAGGLSNPADYSPDVGLLLTHWPAAPATGRYVHFGWKEAGAGGTRTIAAIFAGRAIAIKANSITYPDRTTEQLTTRRALSVSAPYLSADALDELRYVQRAAGPTGRLLVIPHGGQTDDTRDLAASFEAFIGTLSKPLSVTQTDLTATHRATTIDLLEAIR